MINMDNTHIYNGISFLFLGYPPQITSWVLHRICPNPRIEIRGIAFPASLVVMGTQGLDFILGMNWLHRNQATVSCDKRTVKLVSPSGK
jgi:hypothetical protein